MDIHNKVDIHKAKIIVSERLAELEASVGEPLGLMEEKTLEKGFGWVFFYNTKRYLETGEFTYMLAGNAPFIVDKRDGSLHETGTAEPIEIYISKYEEQCGID